MRRCYVITILFSGALFAACQPGLDSVDDDREHVITGVISAVRAQADGFPIEVRVQNAESLSGMTYDTIIVAVWSTTSIFRENTDGSMTPGSTVDLVVGALVRAQHTAALRKSYPPQVDATRVEVRQPVLR